MLFHHFLKRFVKIGTLNFIDSNGKAHCFSVTPTPEISVRLHSKKREHQLFFSPIMALGEGYMEGDITLEDGGDVYNFLYFCTLNLLQSNNSLIEKLIAKSAAFRYLLHQKNPIQKARHNVAHHYDLSEELYRLFLDKDMQYSCAYFTNLDNDLETAQIHKKYHIAAKLRLKPGQKVLDIGSGWGGLALTLARDCGVDVTGLTLSEEQFRVATKRAEEAGLQDRVRFYLRDYREEPGLYDRIVSVGMFEHVGTKHYKDFFTQISSLLKEDGLALLHSIGSALGPGVPNPWLHKYIFPGGYCPALSETLRALEGAKLYTTDIEILHHHYAETLHHWRSRILKQQEKIKKIWGERFFRMWEFYLALCEIAFRKRGYMVFQIQMVRTQGNATLTRDYIWEEEENLNYRQKIPLSLVGKNANDC